MMKKISIALLLTGMMLTGCEIDTAMSPVNMIKPPKLEVNKEEVKEVMKEVLPVGAKLTVPLEAKQLGAINLIDLDGDQLKEAVAFYKMQDDRYSLGMIVLKKERQEWKKVGQIKEMGSQLYHPAFIDFTGDSHPEIVIGFGGDREADKSLFIYELKENELQLFGQYTYNQLAVDDFDYDQIGELILFQFQRNESALGELYKFIDGYFQKVDEIKMDPYVFGYDSVQWGNATKDKIGVFLDSGIGAHSGVTSLIAVEDGKLMNVFERGNEEFQYEKTFKVHPINSEDINGDGIIEIGHYITPVGYEDASVIDTPWITVWYQWDGKDDLVLVQESYNDYNEGYGFDFPIRWNEKVTIKANEYDAQQKWIQVEYIQDQQKKKTIPMFRIDLYNEKEWLNKEQELKSMNKFYYLLKSKLDRYFVATMCEANAVNESDEYQTMIPTEEEIKNNFRLIKY